MKENETMKRRALFQTMRWSAGAALLALVACGGGAAEQVKDPLPADPAQQGSSSVDEGAATTELQRAEAFMQHEKFEEAKGHLEQALKTHPSARAHFDMGVVRERTNDKKGAEESYKEAMKLDAKLVDAPLNLAALYMDDKRIDDAIPVLKAVAAKVPDDERIHQSLAYAYAMKGDVENGSKEFEAALAKNDDPQQRFSYGTMLLEAKQPDKAAVQLKKALAGMKDDAPTLVLLGQMLDSTKSYAECVKAFDRAIKLKATEAEWFLRRGRCRHELNDDAGAEQDFQQSTKLDAKFAPAHYYLGLLYLSQKQRAKGTAEIEQAAKLGAGTPIGKTAKAKLDELSKQK